MVMLALFIIGCVMIGNGICFIIVALCEIFWLEEGNGKYQLLNKKLKMEKAELHGEIAELKQKNKQEIYAKNEALKWYEYVCKELASERHGR